MVKLGGGDCGWNPNACVNGGIFFYFYFYSLIFIYLVPTMLAVAYYHFETVLQPYLKQAFNYFYAGSSEAR